MFRKREPGKVRKNTEDDATRAAYYSDFLHSGDNNEAGLCPAVTSRNHRWMVGRMRMMMMRHPRE